MSLYEEVSTRAETLSSNVKVGPTKDMLKQWAIEIQSMQNYIDRLEKENEELRQSVLVI